MSGRVATVRLTLLDDVVLSSRNATAGAHESLDHIPGAALLGYVASRLYAALAPEDAWTVFHSGRVRFGCALPLAGDGRRACPVPLAWHENKADPAGQAFADGRWHGQRIFNLAAGEVARPPAQFQPRALREGYVTETGQAFKVARRLRMMTAVAQDGRVAEGQLFSYESLCEGQRFECELRAESSVRNDLADQVLDVLRAGPLRIGRSKTSHYGRVETEVESWRPSPTLHDRDPAAVLSIWLLADACLRADDGRPMLEPDAASLGLPGAQLVAERSFIRARRYSPWNGHRASPEIERQLLMAGSVMTLTKDGGFSRGEIERLSWRGIGVARANGFGAVALNSPMLGQTHPVALPTAASEAVASRPATVPKAPEPIVLDPLASSWLDAVRGRAGHASHSGVADRWVASQMVSLCTRWLTIRRYQGWPAELEHGPGATQWGSVAATLARAADWESLRIALLGPAQTPDGVKASSVPGAVRPGDDKWDKPEHAAPAGAGSNGPVADAAVPLRAMASLRDWLTQAFEEAQASFASDAMAGAEAIARLAAAARRHELWSGVAALEVGLKRFETLTTGGRP